jgi:hypothetical protein
LGQQGTDGLSLRTVERYHLGFVELHHSPKMHLPGEVPNDLRESGCRDDDSGPLSREAHRDREDPAIVTFERNPTARVEGDAIHAVSLRSTLSGGEHLLRPSAFPGLQRPASCIQSFVHHRTEGGRIVK